MADPYLFSVKKNVATFSINDAPYNLMPVDYIDRLEEQLPDVLADPAIRAMVFTAEGQANFSAGMNLRQIPEGIKRAGSPDAFFAQRHRVLGMIENGGTPAIATFFGYCLGAGLGMSSLPIAGPLQGWVGGTCWLASDPLQGGGASSAGPSLGVVGGIWGLAVGSCILDVGPVQGRVGGTCWLALGPL